ncbi:hypothetical protein PENTCL1PPCAC_23646, partial [Pristionchus entomophagus]
FVFTQPNCDWDNTTLKLDDGTVHVCRRFLMWHSPYFNSMFLNKENTNEFELNDVRTEGLTELLHVISPSQKLINVDTYMSVLSLAQRFQIE